MSFNWNDYLPLAQQLAGLRNDAARRSAVSRAYYCAFHAASFSIESNKIATNPKYERDRHLKIWNVYMDSTDRECRRIGNGGQRLKFDRHNADYDPDSDFPDTKVQRCIVQAQTLVASIGRNVPEGFSSGKNKLQRAITYLRRFL